MSNHTRIAKNSLYLALRMFVTMLISLFTSRLTLQLLGVSDYGVYSVVGGLVAMVSYINSAMSNSTGRFITYTLGLNDFEKLKKIFNTCIYVNLFLCSIILLLGETVGLWFFYEKLNLPEGTRPVAFVIYQLSIASTILSILTLPYSSLIVAHERMKVFAYFAIIDTVLKLGILYLLYVTPFGRLITYAILMFATSCVYSLIYLIYSHRQFKESHINMVVDKKAAKEMVKFAGWSLFGCTAAITYTQGLNLLLNIFGGTIVNAARGLAVQIQGIFTSFVGNFQTAINPQIIKSYAANELIELHKLIFLSSKYSYYIVLIIACPIIINLETLIKWWLGEIPPYLSSFALLIIWITLVNTLSNSIMKSVDATGKIKVYHVVVGGFLMLILPTSYVALKAGFPLYSVFVVQLIFSAVALFIRLAIARNLIKMTISDFVQAVLLPVGFVTILSYLCISLIAYIRFHGEISQVILSSLIITTINILAIFLIGMTPNERKAILQKIKAKI